MTLIFAKSAAFPGIVKFLDRRNFRHYMTRQLVTWHPTRPH